MPPYSPSPAPLQKRLVDIAFVLQFHLAAVGHLLMWGFMFWILYITPLVPAGEPDEGRFIMETFLFPGIPISFAVLVAVYIVFRCLWAYTKPSTALRVMIGINILHGIFMYFTLITPLRLLIPTILYFIAFCSEKDSEPKSVQEISGPES